MNILKSGYKGRGNDTYYSQSVVYSRRQAYRTFSVDQLRQWIIHKTWFEKTIWGLFALVAFRRCPSPNISPLRHCLWVTMKTVSMISCKYNAMMQLLMYMFQNIEYRTGKHHRVGFLSSQSAM